MSLEQDRIDSYAALVVHVGANVQPGQEVLVAADVAHAAIARAVAEQAYVAGAARVRVEYLDPYVRRSALRHAPEQALTSVVALGAGPARRVDPDRARPTSGSPATPTRTCTTGSTRPAPVLVSKELAARSREMTLSGEVQWTIVAAPNEGWARQVFGEPDLERLWEAVSIAMRLDAGSPEQVVEEWRRHRDKLGARAAR